MKQILLFLGVMCQIGLWAQSFQTANLKAHITYLASDKLQGRAPGTTGEKKSQQYIIRQFKKIGLQPKGTKGFLQPFTYNFSFNPHEANPNAATYDAANVVGYLDNGAANTIIIGAHYDHLGTDGRHSSLEADPAGKIHNGADDNASGVAGMIELARYYAQNNQKEAYNFLFIGFSAEEAGLIGSKYFTANPTLDLTKVHFMFNMDMIGRLNVENKLLVFGTGTSPVFEPLIARTPTNFTIVKDSAGVGPSDHTSFYLKDIPVLFFFTGQHSDYHKPSDDVEKINFEGEQKVVTYIATLCDSLCKYPKLKFLTTRTKEREAVSFKVTLGIMPDYAYQEAGVRIDGVTTGKPAEKAGFKKGDIIVQIGEDEVKEIYSYMELLAKYKKGDQTTVKVKRGSEFITQKIQF